MSKSLVLSDRKIESRIFTIRGLQVMLDRDLAELYGVEVRVLNQAVKRNLDRFPSDFYFQLTKNEFNGLILKSQIVTSSSHGGVRKMPYAFTEQGVSAYHLGASLKDLGKKWFAFSKMEADGLALFVEIKKLK